jgi:hypothetical protein
MSKFRVFSDGAVTYESRVVATLDPGLMPTFRDYLAERLEEIDPDGEVASLREALTTLESEQEAYNEKRDEDHAEALRERDEDHAKALQERDEDHAAVWDRRKGEFAELQTEIEMLSADNKTLLAALLVITAEFTGDISMDKVSEALAALNVDTGAFQFAVNLIGRVAQQTGGKPADFFRHDGRSATWSLRVRIYSRDDLLADTDPDMGPDDKGSLISEGLTNLAQDVYAVVAGFHKPKEADAASLRAALAGRIGSLRVALSRAGGASAAWVIPYDVDGTRYKLKADVRREIIADGVITRVTQAFSGSRAPT